jgi:hypothetical protein
MTGFRIAGLLCGVLAPSLLSASDLSNYRGFQFGMDLSIAARQAGMESSEARLVHHRPAMIQELDWQPRGSGSSVDGDSVQNGLLRFYNNELFRIVITYDRDRVKGMTPEDMIGAISTTYGIATRPKVEVAYHSNYGDVASVLARWEDSVYSYNLVRSGYGDSFAMVMYSKRLDALAAAAIAESVRLDVADAPQREIEALRMQQAADQVALEKARSVNAPTFRP